MADTLTINFGFNKPDLTASNDTWGVKLNNDLDAIDALIFANQTKVNAVEALIQTYLPVGIIAAWNGAINAIPAKWQLCDGTNGTPDLRDKMIIGAGVTYAVNATGGAVNHTHVINGTVLTVDQLPAHSHGVNDPGHSHGVNDPGHSHGVYDPGHSHGVTQSRFNNSNLINGGTSFRDNSGGDNVNTSNAGTGIGIYAAGTGIYLSGSGTGIYLSNSGSGNPHTHTEQAASSLPPYVAKGFIMRV